ncbi:MAG: hypothetical protein ACKVS5_05080 [Parvularculaceae bacterium]
MIKLAAALKGVAGFTGAGAVRHCAWPDGHATLDADLFGIAGLKAEIVVKGDAVGAIACRDGVAAARLDTRTGAALTALQPGDIIEIRQNGAVILRGALAKL